jgi:hypothetical protein
MNPQNHDVGSPKHLRAIKIYKELLEEDGFTEETLDEIQAIIDHEELLLEEYEQSQKNLFDDSQAPF